MLGLKNREVKNCTFTNEGKIMFETWQIVAFAGLCVFLAGIAIIGNVLADRWLP